MARVTSVAAASVLFALAAPQAFACWHVDGEMSESPFLWPEAPLASEVAPGEVALGLAFSRDDIPSDPIEIDFDKIQPPNEVIIIVGCYGSAVFSIVNVLHGDAHGAQNVLVYRGDYPRPRSGIFVGRLLPLKTTARDGSPPAPDSPKYRFLPRRPPQPGRP